MIFRSDVTVELVNSSAFDSDVIRSARVSTVGEESLEDVDTTSGRSVGLINYLMKNRHASPFEHAVMTFYVRAPIFVMREMMRHRTFSFNEESARYRELEPEFYVPDGDRKLIQVGKAGSYTFEQGGPAHRNVVDMATRQAYSHAWTAYQLMLSAGVAREVARIVLPVGTYSSVYMTGNARALMNFLSLRTIHEDAAYPSSPQREIEMVAEKIEEIWQEAMPVTSSAFNAHGRVAP